MQQQPNSRTLVQTEKLRDPRTFAFRRVPTFVDPHPTVSTSSALDLVSVGLTIGSGAAAELEYADVDPNTRMLEPRGAGFQDNPLPESKHLFNTWVADFRIAILFKISSPMTFKTNISY